MSARVWVGLGSNLGDRIANISLACRRMVAHPQVTFAAASALYETPPMGPPQGAFLNAVVGVDTALGPYEFLRLCQSLEKAGRRVRTVHWGPRTIDVDILDFGGMTLDDPDLRLPHPGIAERIFVLRPLADAGPEWRHPVTGHSAAEMSRDLERRVDESIRLVAPAAGWCRGMESNR